MNPKNMKKKPILPHDPTLLECCCDECLYELEQITSKYLTPSPSEKSMNRLVFLLQVALGVIIFENLLFVTLIIISWLQLL